jgi:hypothetical protein
MFAYWRFAPKEKGYHQSKQDEDGIRYLLHDFSYLAAAFFLNAASFFFFQT